jgi:hypothetical protein
MDQLEDIAESLADYFDFDNQDPNDDLYYDPDEIGCPGWDLFTGSETTDREVECTLMYCLVCSDEGQPTWEDISETFPAPNWNSYQGVE